MKDININFDISGDITVQEQESLMIFFIQALHNANFEYEPPSYISLDVKTVLDSDDIIEGMKKECKINFNNNSGRVFSY